MKALLDTHTLFWAAVEPEKIGAEARAILGEPENLVLVSAATALEIATKVRLGKWSQAAPLEANFVDKVTAAGYEILSISVADTLRAGRLPGKHRDPFDRMLAAQALALDIPILSSDEAFDKLYVRRIW